MIDLKPFRKTTDEIEPGATIRVNHTDCGAGEDTRRRLYISRPMSDPMRVIAYCHNCQDSGYDSSKVWESYRKTHEPNPQHIEVTDDVVIPSGLSILPREWPTDAYTWFVNSGLDTSQIQRYQIGLDPSTGRVFLPRYQSMWANDVENAMFLQGYQLRKVDDGKGPKYLTALRPSDKGFTKIFPNTVGETDHIVVVEDLVSGIHVVEACNHPDIPPTSALINYGVKVNLEALDSCTPFKHVIFWLDNDNDHVEEQAALMARTTQMICNAKVSTIKSHSDPKHYSYDTIREVLHG